MKSAKDKFLEYRAIDMQSEYRGELGHREYMDGPEPKNEESFSQRLKKKIDENRNI